MESFQVASHVPGGVLVSDLNYVTTDQSLKEVVL